jgi:predicted metal-binding membrane protein
MRGRTKELRVGVWHGAYCLGCCWALMALLVAFGLMNLLAMVALMAVVLLEKVAPFGKSLSRGIGVAAIACAVAVIFVPELAPGLHHGGSMMTQMDLGR